MTYKIALAQAYSDVEQTVNQKKLTEVVKEAAAHGAALVVFPEMFMSTTAIDATLAEINQHAESLSGPFVDNAKQAAADNQVWIIFGMREQNDDPNDQRVYNTIVIINDQGDVVTTYHKTHLYDAFGTKESDQIKPGDKLFEPIQTPFGKIGLFVCYELRFPEVARYQAVHGADVIIIPTSWYRGPLKEYHWTSLLKARAIENTTFIVGCDKPTSDARVGLSQVVDPMGVVTNQAGSDECILYADIDLDQVAKVRAKLPSAAQRMPELYD
ncbi:carbon-nitrogen hydrolase family protein (plasmid) [Nicoliella spurrieriana]|uniref:Carbon-nitrogen hydrolase family protein n=1 Tax=Nicoliella spurrieriana TaxID=2925830 RepID=A0A976RQL5_9LACO|nr:carbon-nitrogen hydrolase family protein [Nicoliella spurrieriana]UQS85989.1 carbon-nitrogen hydrolase family protein [Nicoliella spurrieriana]